EPGERAAAGDERMHVAGIRRLVWILLALATALGAGIAALALLGITGG
ncbi:MAG: hypothetical protein H7311_10595, partial [Ramlibacter sp.]|nr:hypothetical protein [Cryobacterium sp.]